ncbi:MAG TPA: hypothetical protein PKK10_04495 [Woeseiaceae bacterium]|nr:hypothetical protein [Woeseiaceae bacterium]
MGAFLYIRRPAPSEQAAQDSVAQRSILQMQSRGLQHKALLARNGFDLHIYSKRRFETENVLEFENGSFIVATGTLIYRNRIGNAALAALFEDFTRERLTFENALGHFAVWIYHAGRLSLFTDYQGMYQVYRDETWGLISSSFLAVHAACKTRTPSAQEIYEYLCFSHYYGNQTIIKEVSRLDERFIHQLVPGHSETLKRIRLPEFDPQADFDAQVERTHELLGNYFGALAAAFGNDQSLGLTGGYDSRLTLACLRHCGVSPRVYVQGPDSSIDVRIAKAVAAAGNFKIDHEPDAAMPAFTRDEFAARLQSAYHYIDGFNPAGLFNSWSLSANERSRVPRPERLRLYGMAGEIYRRNLPLANRPCTIERFLTVQADKADYSSFTDSFDKRGFFRAVGAKNVAAMQLDARRLTPEQTELSYPHFRLARNSGWQMSAQNERAHALVPYGEPALSYASGGIRMEFRDLGRFEAALIQRADPVLAAVTSAYGHAFSEAPGLKRRLRTSLLRAVPVAARPLMYRLRAKRRQPPDRAIFQRADYLSAIFPDGFPHVRPLVNVNEIKDAAMLSRALTVELILDGRFACQPA